MFKGLIYKGLIFYVQKIQAHSDNITLFRSVIRAKKIVMDPFSRTTNTLVTTRY